MNHKWLVVNGAIEDWPKNEIKVVKDDLLDPSQFRTETSSLRSRVEYHCRAERNNTGKWKFNGKEISLEWWSPAQSVIEGTRRTPQKTKRGAYRYVPVVRGVYQNVCVDRMCCFNLGVDTSLPALQLAKENVALNGLDPRRISFLRQDATEFMKAAVSRNESWDIVILDPPKLAPRKKVLKNASGMYRNLNNLAMQLTKRGGLLMTCSCSGAMTQSGMFFRILQAISSLIVQSGPAGSMSTFQGAASMAGRKITVVREAGAACDHPIDPAYLEGAYLTNILLRVL
ncbi:hypothetical protein MTR67_033507 [Solanum verrucosum]|uniref:S-adenosylmethionine-dependent methyltransferase domain-containing protein n=1 Tax=Solanum verrucosum TaxID=315347 RepID=A0AAF0U6H4_SOLVR|nr:hypothetical protein MTR67_033507 [Solanum verrucosum]